MPAAHSAPPRRVLGVDIGGSGIKAAPVDTARGSLLAERSRRETPQPATPEAIAAAVDELVREFRWRGPVGATMPAVVRDGVIHSAAHIDPGWIGLDAAALFSEVTGRATTVLNDADSAAIAELHVGCARGELGVVSVVTFGTGIGHGLLIGGRLIPNLEFGHLLIEGRDAERLASTAAREAHDWSWKRWARNVNAYLAQLESIVHPDVIVIGGGAANHADRFQSLLHARAEIRISQQHNDAGIIGVALHAAGVTS